MILCLLVLLVGVVGGQSPYQHTNQPVHPGSLATGEEEEGWSNKAGDNIAGGLQRQRWMEEREEAAARWAPVVWLHPQELYFPGDVHSFLAHVNSSDAPLPWAKDPSTGRQYRLLPSGAGSEDLYLTADTETVYTNSTAPSVLFGQRPVDGVGPPVYVHIHACPDHTLAPTTAPGRQTQAHFPKENFNDNTAAAAGEQGEGGDTFTVTYWFWYPFSHGKMVCISKIPLLGWIPFPLIWGVCLASEVVMGDHVGDWEHLSINFQNGVPKKLYLSIHNFGAFYIYVAESGRFEYESKDARKGPATPCEFPEHLDLEEGRLVVYSANGSHGTWPMPGRHFYHPFVPLMDEAGRGVLWDTGRNMEMIHSLTDQGVDRQWLQYRGHWGNPRRSCHAWLLGNCELGDGPPGIPRQRNNFPCNAAPVADASYLLTGLILATVAASLCPQTFH